MFEEERSKLVPYAGRFDGFHSMPAAVSKTCLVRFDNNKYSVTASAVGRPVEIRAYAERTEFRQDGRLVGDHPRCFGRGRTIYDPWHYVPVLVRKPGALRNGAPFRDRVLPSALEKARRKQQGADDADRQMVVLAAVLTEGLPAVDTACAEALAQGVHSADVILIAALKWEMLTDAEGELSDIIAHTNVAAKGRRGGRAIPIAKDLRVALMVWKAGADGNFRKSPYVVTSERSLNTSS